MCRYNAYYISGRQEAVRLVTVIMLGLLRNAYKSLRSIASLSLSLSLTLLLSGFIPVSDVYKVRRSQRATLLSQVRGKGLETRCVQESSIRLVIKNVTSPRDKYRAFNRLRSFRHASKPRKKTKICNRVQEDVIPACTRNSHKDQAKKELERRPLV